MSKLEFIIDKEGNKSKVVVPVKIWKQLLEDLDDAEDAVAILEAEKEKGKPIPFEEVVKKHNLSYA